MTLKKCRDVPGLNVFRATEQEKLKEGKITQRKASHITNL
jgi:hypothetical protein